MRKKLPWMLAISIVILIYYLSSKTHPINDLIPAWQSDAIMLHVTGGDTGGFFSYEISFEARFSSSKNGTFYNVWDAWSIIVLCIPFFC